MIQTLESLNTYLLPAWAAVVSQHLFQPAPCLISCLHPLTQARCYQSMGVDLHAFTSVRTTCVSLTHQSVMLVSGNSIVKELARLHVSTGMTAFSPLMS